MHYNYFQSCLEKIAATGAIDPVLPGGVRVGLGADKWHPELGNLEEYNKKHKSTLTNPKHGIAAKHPKANAMAIAGERRAAEAAATKATAPRTGNIKDATKSAIEAWKKTANPTQVAAKPVATKAVAATTKAATSKAPGFFARLLARITTKGKAG